MSIILDLYFIQFVILFHSLTNVLVNRHVLNLRRAANDEAGNNNVQTLTSLHFTVGNVLGNIGEPVSQPGDEDDDVYELDLDMAIIVSQVLDILLLLTIY